MLILLFQLIKLCDMEVLKIVDTYAFGGIMVLIGTIYKWRKPYPGTARARLAGVAFYKGIPLIIDRAYDINFIKEFCYKFSGGGPINV